MDPLEKVIRPIVEGQIRGFIKAHPSILKGVTWYKVRNRNPSKILLNSLSKRIVRDLVCAKSRVRISEALLTRKVIWSRFWNGAMEFLGCGAR